MREFIANRLTDRLKGAIVLALVLLAVLAVSGGPDEKAISAAAQDAPGLSGGFGPYYTYDAY